MSFRSPRPNRRRTIAPRPTLECLESRRLLSAVLLGDINPGPNWSGYSMDNSDSAPVEVGDRLVFAATDGNDQFDPWVTDGTPEGTVKLFDVAPGGEHSFIGGIAGLSDGSPQSPGGLAYVLTARGQPDGDQRLLVTDGTPAGTREVAAVEYAAETTDLLSGGGAIQPPVVVGGLVYFIGGPAGGDAHGLMRSDGTAAGTFLIKNRDESFPFANLTAVGDTFFFTTRDRLWKSDGTAAGTVVVKSFPTTADSKTPSDLSDVNGALYFRAVGRSGFPQLWKSDGTPDGTVLLKEFTYRLPSWSDSTSRKIYNVNGAAVFVGVEFTQSSWENAELWTSDGTPEGTRLLRDVEPGTRGSDPLWLAKAGGALYFSAETTAEGRELWKTDGTAAGTVMVADLAPRSFGSAPRAWPAPDDQAVVYFTANDYENGNELWMTDGTTRGTRLVRDQVPGSYSGGYGPAFATPIGGGVFVRAIGAGVGYEPFVFFPPPPPAVVGRHVFYNNSTFDGGNAAHSPADDNAVAPDKRALLPGQAPTLANVTSYSRGINGVMVDIAHPWSAPTWDDFEFRMSPPGSQADPATWQKVFYGPTISVRPGAGVGGSHRVTITWADGALRDRWLQVTVKPAGRTGLFEADVFYFGNLVGDTGDAAPVDPAATPRVDAADVMAVRRAARPRAAGLTSRYDFNRDGVVDVRDEVLARANQSRSLPVLAPSSDPQPTAQAAPRRTRGAYRPAEILMG